MKPLAQNLWRPIVIGGPSAVGAVTSQGLTTAWVAGSAGTGLGFRFVAPSATTLVDVYAFVATGSTGGTIGSVVELHAATGATTMSATVLATAGSQAFTASGSGGSNKWYRFTFASPPTLTAGATYFVTLGVNAAGDTVNVQKRNGLQTTNEQGVFLPGIQLGSGGSANASSTDAGTCVLVFGDGSTVGHPYVATASDASSALERGIKVDGFDVAVSLSGASFGPATNANALKVYDAATAPGGTTLLTVPLDATAAATGVIRFPAFTLAAGTPYRVVLGFSAASTGPGVVTITNESTFGTVLESAGYAAQGLKHCVDNGAGGWTDSTDKMPRLNLLIGGLAEGGYSRGRMQ